MYILKAKANHSYFFISKKLKEVSSHDLRLDLVNATSYTIDENGQPQTYCLLQKTFKGNYKIPYGLLGRIKPIFLKYNIKLKIKLPHREQHDIIPLEDGFNGKLRPYQIRAYKKGLKYGRGIYNHATGAGKTIEMSALIFSFNVKTLFLVPNKTLLHSTAKEIKKFTDYEVGVFGDGYKQTNSQIVIATAQSITAWLGKDKKECVKWLKEFKCLILDEVHHAGSLTWKVISFLCINAQYRFGCTGTVTRGDGAVLLLHATTDEVIDTITPSFLIKLHYLAKPYIYFIEYCKDPGEYINELGNTISLRNKMRNWKVVQNKFLVGDAVRNYAIKNIANKLKRKKSILITTSRVNHGHKLKEDIKGSKFLSGSSSTQERDEKKYALKDKELMCLIATSIFNEGVNIPSLDVLIKIGGGKSVISNMQIIGRVLRGEDKDKALIIDFMDYKNQVIYNHSIARKELLEKEPEFVVRIITLKEFLETKIRNLYK